MPNNNSERVQCPRCLGKGHVDWDDIKRLNMELRWTPGHCAYCDGQGSVLQEQVEKVNVDSTYLTADLDKEEREKLLNNDLDTVVKGITRDMYVEEVIDQIQGLHFDAGLSVEQIMELYSVPANQFKTPEEGQRQLREYIEKIIELSGRK